MRIPPASQTRRASSRRAIARRVAGGAALIAAGLAMAGCTASSTAQHSGATSGPSTGTASSSATSPSAAAATFDVQITSMHSLNPITPVTISVNNATLTDVTMVNQTGKHVTGTITGGTSWHNTEVLGYGKTYTITAHATDSAGQIMTKTEKISTLEPASTNTATIDRMGGYELDGDETYGVALIPVVHFSSPVTYEAAAQKSLQVHTSQPVAGVWSWVDNQDVAYRPQNFWPAHTQVQIDANVYGVQLAKGEYGASDESVSYTIGRKEVTVADDNAPEVDKVRVYNAAGQVLRTMDTSMGQHGGETLPNGTYINFYTLNGTYTVLEHDNPALMSSQSYGLPANAPNGYPTITVPYSTKISTDGIYLHEYNSTEYDQTHGIDASEGCLNLVTADAVWYYDNTLIGDPVIVHGEPKAPEIQPWEGGYWSVPWKTWVAGSA